MRRFAVLVPGMMGSVLEEDGYYGRTQTLWGEDLTENYHALINSVGLLRWADNPARARLMRFVNVSASVPLTDWQVPFRKLDLWGRVIKLLDQRADIEKTIEFGYDWRAPLLDSARSLAESLKDATGISAELEPSADDIRFVLIAHSMGGLVVRIALAAGLIHPRRIDRIVHVGTPLKGSPTAFRTAYERLSLPLFHELFGLIRRKNKAAFEHHLLECIRSFPSLYHLLPPREIPYLYYSPSSRSNPLREKSMPLEQRKIAAECHKMLELAQKTIATNNIRASTIYTEVHAGRTTELEYKVTPLARDLGYIINGVHADTALGDGTVSADSARGELPVQGLSVINVDHMVMCNSHEVVKCLNALL
jgi:Lecithin:cholesterol acyltransferase